LKWRRGVVAVPIPAACVMVSMLPSVLSSSSWAADPLDVRTIATHRTFSGLVGRSDVAARRLPVASETTDSRIRGSAAERPFRHPAALSCRFTV